jgi:hypothetical protein
MSPCRSDYIFTGHRIGVWRVVSEDFWFGLNQPFLLIFRTFGIFTDAQRRRVPKGCTGFSSIWPNFTKATIPETLGPFWSFTNTQKSRVNGVSHCALLLHVAMQFGLYHLLEKGAWRKVSEDSGESRPFLLIDCTEKIFTTAQQPER